MASGFFADLLDAFHSSLTSEDVEAIGGGEISPATMAVIYNLPFVRNIHLAAVGAALKDSGGASGKCARKSVQHRQAGNDCFLRDRLHSLVQTQFITYYKRLICFNIFPFVRIFSAQIAFQCKQQNKLRKRAYRGKFAQAHLLYSVSALYAPVELKKEREKPPLRDMKVVVGDKDSVKGRCRSKENVSRSNFGSQLIYPTLPHPILLGGRATVAIL